MFPSNAASRRPGPSRKPAPCFIRDANRFAVAYVYFATEIGYTRYLMTKDEARTIAATLAKLPELFKRSPE